MNINSAIFLFLIIILNGEFVWTRNDVSKTTNSGLEFVYHNFSSMTKFLKQITSENADLASLYPIGKSVRKRELWVVEISAVKPNVTKIPNIKLLGNIHGNEAAGREVLLHFINYLIESYRKGDIKVKHLLENNRIHILPSLNPDGFEIAIVGQCKKGPGRHNVRDEDLNRSFPDYFRKNPRPIQPETLALLKWMHNKNFVLSASLHGGAMVANYPFESTKQDLMENEANISPDDDVFQHLALVYSQAHPVMHKGEPCEKDGTRFVNGITNGAAWYGVTGGMQDYNYAMHGCMEITLEISCCKYPKANKLKKIWEENKNALVEYSLQTGKGVRGIIMDYTTKNPIANANLTIDGRDMVFFTSNYGEFFRILLPGNYILKVKFPNYRLKTTHFTVHEVQPEEFSRMTELEIFLKTFDDGEYEDEITTPMALESTTEYIDISSTVTNGIFWVDQHDTPTEIESRSMSRASSLHIYTTIFFIVYVNIFKSVAGTW